MGRHNLDLRSPIDLPCQASLVEDKLGCRFMHLPVSDVSYCLSAISVNPRDLVMDKAPVSMMDSGARECLYDAAWE